MLANDLAGFPNGRRLADDVTDIELRVIAGALLKPEQGGKQIPLGDGVDQNDKAFRSSFPYVALPHGRADGPRASGRSRRTRRSRSRRPEVHEARGGAATDRGPALAPLENPHDLPREHPFRRAALAAGLAFLVALAVLMARGDDPVAPRGPAAEVGSVRPSSASTAAEIRRLQAAVRRAPGAAAPRVALAGEYLQRVRETGDAAFYARAETLLRGVLARDPGNADALVALGGLALSRHDFRGGLALARRSDAGLSALPVVSTRSSSSAATARRGRRCSGWST